MVMAHLLINVSQTITQKAWHFNINVMGSGGVCYLLSLIGIVAIGSLIVSFIMCYIIVIATVHSVGTDELYVMVGHYCTLLLFYLLVGESTME